MVTDNKVTNPQGCQDQQPSTVGGDGAAKIPGEFRELKSDCRGIEGRGDEVPSEESDQKAGEYLDCETPDSLTTLESSPLSAADPKLIDDAKITQSDVESHDLEALEAMMGQVADGLASGFQEVLGVFAEKLAYDTGKDKQLTRLHDELQEHKKDLLARTVLPFVNGLIRLHDDMGKANDAIAAEGIDQFEPKDLLKMLDEFRDDIEVLMDNNGIATFQEPGDEFTAKRQQVLEIVTTSDRELHGHIAERVRAGFERGDRIIRREKVKVYKYREPPEDTTEEVP